MIPSSSGAHQVHALAARIEEETGQKITEESLRAAIKLANDKRRALQRLSATRAADPVPISGLDCPAYRASSVHG
jgi:benzoyl-CoA reductase/2-hydroxyglutaryl-CoA dehydratase subunit BcrC/BadD/HgdB